VIPIIRFNPIHKICGLNRRKRIKLLFFLMVILLFAAAFDVRLKVKRYEIMTDRVTNPLKIALITDLHGCRYGKEEKRLIRAIDNQQPDIILLGGDICDDVIPDDNVEYLLREIAGRYPCYYVTGNHEYWSGRIDDMMEMFRSYGVTVLNGSVDKITINEQRIMVCGVTDPDAVLYTGDGVETKTQLEHIRSEADRNSYRLLLSHRPELFGLYLQYDFDLVLAGHAHGGQWRLPGFINGVFAPDQGWFPKYAGGIYVAGDTAMIVSRGLARESTKVPRIFNRPELVIVTITPCENK
jgi:predicted MPP superfamily phosphohydrolase